MSPVKVFGSPPFTNVARVLLCLEEVGAEYEIVDVDFGAMEHKGPDHLSRNSAIRPSSGVPGWRPDALPSSDEANLLREGVPEEAAAVDAWLDVEALRYEPDVHAVFVQHRVVPVLGGEPDERVIAESVARLEETLAVYEARLAKRRYLAGDGVSLADLSHFPYTRYFMEMPYAAPVFAAYPRVTAWWERLSARPAVRKVASMMAGGSAGGSG
ncbi:probable glutathione S-transferase GSTF1 isoform X2 [Oryza brachyantha]|uniref:probable glutathione S-transferase GSTF1 isoform X2 n=1 Tax=Oryza brachyantha TaxID=4533 RepID=UPI001ADA8619|nr:probable glutathione S-transferase GSTF1 isoform X2 [Oryza brachyantha]